MHFTHQLGLLGELKAAAKFVELGFSIYTSISDGVDPFDFIAHRDNRLIKVQVKSTSSKTASRNSYPITLRTVTIHKSRNVYTPFDPSKCDVLAIYIKPLDTVCFILTTILNNTGSIYLRELPPKNKNQYKSWIISEHTDLSKAIQSLQFRDGRI